MKVVVTIPWRPGDKYRVRNYGAVHAHLSQVFPDALPIYAADSGHQPFSRAATRNQCVQYAEYVGGDVVVINDADSIVDAAGLHSAVTAAAASPLIQVAYTHYRALSARATVQYLRGARENLDTLLDATWPIGGAIVTTPRAWWSVGGMDERFIGWGWRMWLSRTRTPHCSTPCPATKAR